VALVIEPARIGREGRILLWLGASAAIVVAALTGIAAILGASEFEVRHARIVGTGIVALAAGGAALAGLATATEEPRRPLGWAVLALAPVTFAALVLAIWWETGWDRHGERLGRVVLSALVLLLAALVVGTIRRALGFELLAVRILFWAYAALVTLTAAFAVAAIWAPSVDEVGRQTERIDTVERVLSALFVAIVAGFLLVPLVERALRLSAKRRQGIDRRTA
jgi:hypothetical protein